VFNRHHILSWGVLLAGLAIAGSGRALAQGPQFPENPVNPGASGSLLGPAPGAGGQSGNQESPQILGGRPGASTPRVPTTISNPASSALGPQVAPSIAPPSGGQDQGAMPIYGSLEVTNVAGQEGPPDGMTLDQAIERALRDNLDLRAQNYEIPQAEADILTASLRSNPIFYADAQLVPYGQYTNARPGGQTQYDVNVSYPLDLTQKRKYRTISAARAKKVLEAQFQDAVRNQIDNVYGAFVNVLQARTAVFFSEKGVEGLRGVLKATEDLAKAKLGEVTEADVRRVEIQLKQAEIGLNSNREAFQRAKRALGEYLNMTPAEAEAMEVRGSLQDTFPAPPPSDDLTKMALRSRPDINSFRLGVSRAQADVRLAQANILPDVYVLYQPYTLQDNTYQGLKSPTSWALGVTIPIPLYNRNQGAIKRARLNVTQTEIQLASLEHKAANDVRQAEQAYITSLQNVKRMEETIVPDAEKILKDSERLFRSGQLSLILFLAARKDYNDVAKQYLDALVAHRQSMLDLNTAVGIRILP
jgi:cobalt-zinc-cadmium efflux system outer membrane protein